MSFGKRDAASVSAMRELARQVSVSDGKLAAGPALKASKSGLDAAFLALVAGVVVVSAGAAIAAPSVLSWVQSFGPQRVLPISDVVAGLDPAAAKSALAKQAFPDPAGRAFMTALASRFPEDHDALLARLAERAVDGADRNGLLAVQNEWLAQFAVENMSLIARTGAKGFDAALNIVSGALGEVKHAAGACDFRSLEAFASDPQNLLAITAYGGGLYAFNMRASAQLVVLAAEGRNAPEPDSTLTSKDELALQQAMISLMTDKQLMTLFQAAAMASSSGDGPAAARTVAGDIDLCQLGQSAIAKLQTLPPETKSRLMGLAGAEARKLMANGGPGALFGPGQIAAFP